MHLNIIPNSSHHDNNSFFLLLLLLLTCSMGSGVSPKDNRHSWVSKLGVMVISNPRVSLKNCWKGGHKHKGMGRS